MAKKTIVLANGDIADIALIRTRLQSWQDAIVIAADGGYRHANHLELELHTVIGDLDSIEQHTKESLLELDVKFQHLPQEKDETDLELALLHAVQLGAEQILILGAVGGRLDMTLSNLQLLSLPVLQKVHVELWNGDQTVRVIHPPGDKIHGHPGDTLSLIPLTGIATGITTSNLKYPLYGESLTVGFSRGLSNVLMRSTANIAIREGVLLAIHTPGRA